MKTSFSILCLGMWGLSAVTSGATVDYFIWDDWGGTYADAEKYSGNSEHDEMCWAAAAANALEWTGWGKVEGMTERDEIFDYYVDHFTPGAGSPPYAWQWWFTGYYGPQNAGYSKVDVAGGGNFWGEVDFYSNLDWYLANENTMAAIDIFLHDGKSTTLAIRNETWAHAVNCWGFGYDSDSERYDGIWITDSEDSMDEENPPDRLEYYPIEFIEGKWRVEGYKVECYISEIAAIPDMSLVIPEPATVALLMGGMVAARVFGRRKRHQP